MLLPLSWVRDPSLGPSGGTVRDSKRLAEVSRCQPSTSTRYIHDRDAKDVQGRIHARLNRDPATQKSALGTIEPVQMVCASLSCSGAGGSLQDLSAK